MRVVTIIIFCLFFSSSVLVNCAQSSKKTRKPVTSIKISNKNTNFIIGDKLSVHLKVKIKDGSLNKTELFLDGKLLCSNENMEFLHEIETTGLYVGTHLLKTITSTNDGTTGENYSEFLLLSDIVPQKFGYKIIRSYPHSVLNFTEGLEIRNGFLYEGTGQEGSSAIYKSDLSTSKIVREYKLKDEYFGEGITVLNGKLYQLTYKTQLGFVRDLESFETLKTWYFKNEQGWGLTNDGKYLIMSDGTEFLYYLDPLTFNEIKRIQVCDNKGAVKNLNELEYINGEIWANIWTTDKIVRIDPGTGKIIAEINLGGLLPSSLTAQNREVDVLNGIAYDAAKNKIYVTGKFWPKLFEIEVVRNIK